MRDKSVTLILEANEVNNNIENEKIKEQIFLATTAIDTFWDKNKKILFLGPWCLLNNKKDEWSRLDYEVLENPWSNKEDFYSAATYTKEIYEHLLTKLSDYLNSIHKTDYTMRYWRILIGPWLYRYIGAFYDRYNHLNQALKKYPKLKTIRLSESSFITPNDINDFISLYTNDFYNLQLYSQILTLMGLDFPKKEFELELDIYSKRKLFNFKDKGKQLYLFLMERFSAEKDIIIADLYMPRHLIWKLIKDRGSKIGFKKENWNTDVLDEISLSPAFRDNLKHLPAADQFTDLLVKSLYLNFPKIYLEGYKQFHRQILKRNKYPRVLMSSIGWFFNEFFKFYSAEASENETQLLAYQHGGNYGTSKWFAEHHEIELADTFYSWGWNSDKNIKIKPLANPNLSFNKENLSKIDISKNEKILFVGTSLPRYFYFFISFPLGGEFYDYLDHRNIFIRTLSKQYKDQLLIRLNATADYGIEQANRLKNDFPNLQFDSCKSDFFTQMARSKITVHDYPGSTYLESLSTNLPCILYWSPKHWEMRKQAIPYFDQLKRAEILFDDPVKAAKKLMLIYNDPWSWWLSEEVQSARSKFADRFALTDNNWLNKWLAELK